jgi:hypothetical protein
LNNDANEVPLLVQLNKEDPGYEIKMKLINETQKNFLKFRVVDNLEDRVMAEFLSWLRYSEYEGDLAVLYLAKNEAINEYQRKRGHNKRDSDDSDDVDLQDVFKGTTMNAINLENETKVWLRIARLATESMKRYETTP